MTDEVPHDRFGADSDEAESEFQIGEVDFQTAVPRPSGRSDRDPRNSGRRDSAQSAGSRAPIPDVERMDRPSVHTYKSNASAASNASCMSSDGSQLRQSNMRHSNPRELAIRRMQLTGQHRKTVDTLQDTEAETEDVSESDDVSQRSSDAIHVERSKSKKTTLGGFTIIRTDSDSGSDSSDSAVVKRKDSQNEERLKNMENMNTLIDNEMSQIMASRSTIHGNGPVKPKLERALSQLEEEQDEELGKKLSVTGKGKSNSSGRRKSPPRVSIGSIHEDTIRSLFAPGAAKHWKPYHAALNRVVKHIFALDDVSIAIKNGVMQTSDSKVHSRREQAWSCFENICAAICFSSICGLSRQYLVEEFRQRCHKIATNSVFLGFFLVLTVYALFGPDMAQLLGSKETDQLFVILNTITFFLFIVELILLILGHKSYIFTVPCALDVVAIASFISDTALLTSSDDMSTFELAQQTRMTRLTRITRVARVTRLVPRILALFRRNKTALAKRLLLRRLYRAFQFLDTDQDGLISSFDVKTFYLNVLQDCPQMFKMERMQCLQMDSDTLLNINGSLEDEHANTINYQDFCRIILGMHLGHEILNYHLADIEHSKGVYRLTTKLSDRTALKVCIGILLLIIIMHLLDIEVKDISTYQELVHLHFLARMGSGNLSQICQSIDAYREDHKLLYLVLQGRTYFDIASGFNVCASKTFLSKELNFRDKIQDVLDSTGLRSSEVIQACWPSSKGKECKQSKNESLSLVDNVTEVKDGLVMSTIGTLIVIIILLVFIALMNRGISKFSRTTLHPLRALVDDMMAISSLELINIDADVPMEMVKGNWVHKSRRETDVEELQHLQKSFKSMRGAIRSWSRYVPPSVVQRLFSAGIEATIGVSRVTATILFIDVYDFEDACRGLSPNEVNNTLGSVLGRIAMVIQNNRGTLLEFIGDEVLAVFNTPSSVRNHVYSGVASALEIHTKIAELPPIVSSEGTETPIRCRCGVHTAVILAGNIGSHRRMKFGLLGDGVNLSARLKGINTKYRTQTICSENVFHDEFSARKAVFRPLDLVAVKGKTEAIMVYEIMGFAKGEELQRCKVIKEASAKHSEAYRYYLARDFRRSKAIFEDVAVCLEELKHNTVMVCGRDEPARQMKRRCQAYIQTPPGPEWDGVERLKKKVFELAEEDDKSAGSLEEVTSEAEALKSKSTASGGYAGGTPAGLSFDDAPLGSDRSRAGTQSSHDMDDASSTREASNELSKAILCPCSSFNARPSLLCQDSCASACAGPTGSQRSSCT